MESEGNPDKEPIRECFLGGGFWNLPTPGEHAKITYNYLELQTTVFLWLFHWMIPNQYIKNGCFTKHPLKNGCLGYQVLLVGVVDVCYY